MSSTQSYSPQIDRKPRIKASDYPPDVVKLVQNLRRIASTERATNIVLKHVFDNVDKDKSGSVDVDEFKLVLRRFVCHDITVYVLCRF